MGGPHRSRRKKIFNIIVPPGQEPPEEFELEGIRLTLIGPAKGNQVIHYIYRAPSGWLITFTDRAFAAGIEVVPSTLSHGIFTTGDGNFSRKGWRE